MKYCIFENNDDMMMISMLRRDDCQQRKTLPYKKHIGSEVVGIRFRKFSVNQML